MEKTELLACPFCGKDPKIETFNDGFFDYSRISCCFVEFAVCADKTGKKAMRLWNRRTPTEADNNALTQIKTYELVRELERRDGVETHTAEPYKDLSVSVNGPAVVLVVID